MTQEQFSFVALGVLMVIVFRVVEGKINGPGKPPINNPRAGKHYCPICGHYHSNPDNQPRNG